ncbi:MAG: hypothetical protein IPP87_14725 [Ideonella sp.]|nr:hypothetical protein [Ideonella sp.]
MSIELPYRPCLVARWIAALAVSTALSSATPVVAAGLKLHVPSPDWRDQVIYFVMTDRFDDGDPATTTSMPASSIPSGRIATKVGTCVA